VTAQSLILKRASASRSSGEWNDDDFDVLADGAMVGRIFKADAVPMGMPSMWTLAFGHHEDRTPTHGYAAALAMTAFAKAGGGSDVRVCKFHFTAAAYARGPAGLTGKSNIS